MVMLCFFMFLLIYFLKRGYKGLIRAYKGGIKAYKGKELGRASSGGFGTVLRPLEGL